MSVKVFEEPFLSKFSKKQEIARGLRGVIRCVVDENGQVFAAKTIRKNQKGQSVVDEINAEIKALEICSPIARVQIFKKLKNDYHGKIYFILINFTDLFGEDTDW